MRFERLNGTERTVGVPCRDEGQDFGLFACGLRDAMKDFEANVPVEVIICVNGSREGFSKELLSILQQTGLADFDVRVISSIEGKLNAMKAIVKHRMRIGYLAFVDSDVVLAPNVLRLLWETLETDHTCMVSYGQPVPVFPAEPNTIHRLSRVHYALRERAYRRLYFHGRTFMLREWFFDDPNPLADLHSSAAKRLKLERGPLVDDIAMSRMAVARWGKDAIREVPQANVYFDPPDDLRGLYAGVLRVTVELRRLDCLYPQHAHLQRDVFANVWRREGLRRFSWKVRTLHAAHRALHASLRCVAQAHVLAVTYGVLRLDTLWIRVPGTKSFARHRQSWGNYKKRSKLTRTL